jgi:asparagine synthase (glutamine-hydrolysing)
VSAIFGVYHLDGKPVAQQEIERMSAALIHRGPDGSRVWRDGNVGFGHQMLWTTPESLTEVLPFTTVDGRFVITADARIDNRDELISLLKLEGRPADTITDSELIVTSYEKWGERCPEKLLGDFVFAIWDKPNQSMFCARDHFGVKPFYYFLSDKLFVFASEIKAVLSLPEVPRRLNEVKVAEHLSVKPCVDEITFFADVNTLTKAHFMSVRERQVKIQAYWALDPERRILLGSDDEYAEALREHFTESVRCRLRSAYPVGSMLSGGLDSSSIACVARELLKEQNKTLHTFSVMFEDVPESDEKIYIDAVVAQNGIESHYAPGDKSGPMSFVDEMMWHCDNAMVPGNLHFLWRLYKESLKEQGVRTILDGWDGDTTVSHGTEYFIDLARAKKYITLFRETWGYSRYFEKTPPLKVFWWNLEHFGLSPQARKTIRPLQKATRAVGRRAAKVFGEKHELSSFSQYVREDFARRVLPDNQRTTGTGKRSRKNGSSNQVHLNRLTAVGMTQNLELMNNAAAAFSVDLRFPFWDKRLIEFCVAIPSEQKLNKGLNRMVMRRAMKGMLPESVRLRGGKVNMAHAFEYSLRKYNSERFSEVITSKSSNIAEYVRTDLLAQAHDRYLKHTASEADVLVLWKSACLALWLQRNHLC